MVCVAMEPGEICADVVTSVLVVSSSRPVLQVALRGTTTEIDDAWIDAPVTVVLDGVRSRARRVRSLPRGHKAARR